MTLYETLKQAGVKIENHCSDLHCPVTNQTKAILKQFGVKAGVFKDRIDGGFWYDIFAAYDPYWEGKGAVIITSCSGATSVVRC